MKDKVRKCVGCQNYFDRTQMFRILKNHKTNEIILNPPPTEFGRSVYICKNPQCVEKAFKKGRINRIAQNKNCEKLKIDIQKNLTN